MTRAFFAAPAERLDSWEAPLRALHPGLKIFSDQNPPPPGVDVPYALAWNPPRGRLAALPGLKLIFALGAGVDALLADQTLPSGIPLVRVVDDLLTLRMVEYVVLHVLAHHRRLPELLNLQHARIWDPLPAPHAGQRRVGILGLGELGRAAAAALAGLGFKVSGWSRRGRPVPGITVHTGEEGLHSLLAASDSLICLLPLTADTKGLLNRARLGRLPKGAAVINAGRGQQLVQDDLLALLDAGHLAGASLDVFDPEPLPQDHPLWAHPRVLISPHNASLTDPQSVAPQIIANIARAEQGLPLLNLVDRAQGY